MPDLCIIPAAALLDESLTGTDIRVLCAIGKHTDRNGVGCWAKAATLAEEARVSRNQFFISTRRLLASGYIERDSGKEEGAPSNYAIVFPSIKKGGVSKSGTPGEYPKTGEGSPTKQGSPTINVPLNATSTLGKRFSETELETINNVLSRVPESGRISWTSDINAMLSGMPGHTLASPADIAKAFQDLAGNGKAGEPNMRQWRRYVADAVEAAKENSSATSLIYARELWEVIRRYGILTAQTRESALELFQNAASDKVLLAFQPDVALEIFMSLDRGSLRAATSTEFPIRHIADRIAKRSRGSHLSLTGGANNGGERKRANG